MLVLLRNGDVYAPEPLTPGFLAIYDIRMHVLNADRRFNLETRRPEPTPVESAMADRKEEAVAS